MNIAFVQSMMIFVNSPFLPCQTELKVTVFCDLRLHFWFAVVLFLEMVDFHQRGRIRLSTRIVADCITLLSVFLNKKAFSKRRTVQSSNLGWWTCSPFLTFSAGVNVVFIMCLVHWVFCHCDLWFAICHCHVLLLCFAL